MASELIAYFSRRGENLINGEVKDLPIGNTEVAANILQRMIQAEAFQIEPAQPYSADYCICINEAKKDLRRGVRPALKSWPEHMQSYDVLYLGYPNFWGTMPAPVYTFLERYDFTGKTILPFCTHEGGRMGRSEDDLRQLCPTASVGRGLALRGADVRLSDHAFEHWLQDHGRYDRIPKKT